MLSGCRDEPAARRDVVMGGCRAQLARDETSAKTVGKKHGHKEVRVSRCVRACACLFVSMAPIGAMRAPRLQPTSLHKSK